MLTHRDLTLREYDIISDIVNKGKFPVKELSIKTHHIMQRFGLSEAEAIKAIKHICKQEAQNV